MRRPGHSPRLIDNARMPLEDTAMKIADVLPQITILPLRRFADAWDVEVIRSDKRDVFEQAILGSVARIGTSEAVSTKLLALERSLDYLRWSNAEAVLRLILHEPGYVVLDDAQLAQRVLQNDASLREYAVGANALRHLDVSTQEIYRTLLEVAWEDRVSADEYQLIRRLQRKLGICHRDHQVLELRTVDRPAMTPQDVENALRDLSYNGFVCQFRLAGNTQVVIPEEIATHLRGLFGIVLQAGAYRALAARLSAAVIREALEVAKQPSVSNRKDFLVDRLIDGDVSPATVLDRLDADALDELLRAVSDSKPPSMKAVKIRHIIAQYDKLAAVPVQEDVEDPNRVYYAYLAELASRQYDVLRTAGVIQHDQNVDRAFERGVRYAFSELLGHPPISFTGTAHADGGVPAANGRMALWDCKSALTPYALTEPKAAQFLQYVSKEVPVVVSPFLIISCGFTPESAGRAMALKANCPPGTEVGLLTAEDLKWLCERWRKESPDKRLPLEVLAHTGVLDRNVLDMRLKLFAPHAQAK
jgi:hypothetical protein